MGDAADKLAYFQAITGIDDPDLCSDILTAHGWDLELAISSITSNANPSDHHHEQSSAGAGAEYDAISNSNQGYSFGEDTELIAPPAPAAEQPGLVWKVVTLPISIISGSLGLVSGAIGLGFWAAGGILSYSLGMVGLGSGRGGEISARNRLASVSAAVAEATEFVASFERDFGRIRPRFVAEGFMDALQRSRREFKLMFVYLHSPDHPDTPGFCSRTLGNEALVEFVNENFVAWGGSIRASEGFKMSNSLKASRYPFCAVVMAATNQRIALLLQIEGPKSPEEMINLLQRVLEESSLTLTTARLDAEERLNSMRLREEQDAAYRAALEADQAREQQRREEVERLEREAAEAERKKKEEEEALERAAREAAEREIALTKLREEKALSLGTEPEKGPDVTQVLVRFPTGERKGRRFQCSAPVQSVYDYVDSLGCLQMDSYLLASNFPRTVYGPETLSKSLKEAGLHPQASLFVESKS